MKSYALHRSRDGTGVVTNRGIWWAKKEIVEVRVAEHYLSLIPIRHHPSFVAALVESVTYLRAYRNIRHNEIFGGRHKMV